MYKTFKLVWSRLIRIITEFVFSDPEKIDLFNCDRDEALKNYHFFNYASNELYAG